MSKEAKHTPGPWVFHKSDNFGSYSFCAYSQSPLKCMASFQVYAHTYGNDAATIAKLGRAEANARLIAAAPELLETASRVMAILEEHGPSIVPHLLDSDDNAGQRLRDAIAKATGKELAV